MWSMVLNTLSWKRPLQDALPVAVRTRQCRLTRERCHTSLSWPGVVAKCCSWPCTSDILWMNLVANMCPLLIQRTHFKPLCHCTEVDKSWPSLGVEKKKTMWQKKEKKMKNKWYIFPWLLLIFASSLIPPDNPTWWDSVHYNTMNR